MKNSKHFLMIGGVHGSGKTSLVHRIREQFPHIYDIPESVDLEHPLYQYRDHLRDTLEIGWYADYVCYIIDNINRSDTDKYVIDRTMYDFIPYCNENAARFIENDAKRVLSFLTNQGHTIEQVYITASMGEIENRVAQRRRFCHEEELRTIKQKDMAFREMAERMGVDIIENRDLDETIKILVKKFPEFFNQKSVLNNANEKESEKAREKSQRTITIWRLRTPRL